MPSFEKSDRRKHLVKDLSAAEEESNDKVKAEVFIHLEERVQS